MYRRGFVEIDRIAVITFWLIVAVPVSTMSTPSSPACTVMLPPAPISTWTLPCTGSTWISPGGTAVSAGAHIRLPWPACV